MRAYYATKANRFLAPAHVSFQQIYFSPNHRPDAASDARAVLAAIPVAADPAAMGDPIALEPEFLDLDRQAVAGLFGDGFADAVFKLAPGTWAGPVNSAYGLHLVQVTAVTPPTLPPFEAVRTKVLEEWRHEKEAAAKSAYLASLREKYGVIIDAENRSSSAANRRGDAVISRHQIGPLAPDPGPARLPGPKHHGERA